MLKKILQGISLALFVLPPGYFVFKHSAQSSIFTIVNISGCFIFLIGFLFAKRFMLNKAIKRWEGMITIWMANEKTEIDPDKRHALLCQIRKYENILLALKIPVPTLIIGGMLFFLFAVQKAAESFAAMLGICSIFWVVAVALLFVTNGIGIKKP